MIHGLDKSNTSCRASANPIDTLFIKAILYPTLNRLRGVAIFFAWVRLHKSRPSVPQNSFAGILVNPWYILSLLNLCIVFWFVVVGIRSLVWNFGYGLIVWLVTPPALSTRGKTAPFSCPRILGS